jgi:hypothetical protein
MTSLATALSFSGLLLTFLTFTTGCAISNATNYVDDDVDLLGCNTVCTCR